MRVGHGYDIHRFENQITKTKIILGGVEIPYKKGLVAHSDGDVVIHALCDALLGASALGDIGQHFPDTDPTYRNYDSRKLLRNVVKMVGEKGYQVGNIDITIIAQSPKILPYVSAMKINLATDLQVTVEEINIKATTHERLGALGREEGIAVHAVVLIKNYENIS